MKTMLRNLLAKLLLLPILAQWSNHLSGRIVQLLVALQLFSVRITLYLVQWQMDHNYLMKMRSEERKEGKTTMLG